MTEFTIINADCLTAMKGMPDNSVDAIVTDPPYGLSFMNRAWDYGVPQAETWREALRVLKPGGHLLSFFGSRTYHRGVVQIEDAGFEIRDCIMWVYATGFPKSLDVSKAIDKVAGAERERIGRKVAADGTPIGRTNGNAHHHDGYKRPWRDKPIEDQPTAWETAPATDAARQWQGWGTALKPSFEPIVLARKPLVGTVAENVLQWGTGGMNVDGCRVGTGEVIPGGGNGKASKGASWGGGDDGRNIHEKVKPHTGGRWPANLIHDGSPEVLAGFPKTTSGKPCGKRNVAGFAIAVEHGTDLTGYDDSGSAARFFYCPKASKADRDEGLDGRNTHPTVKPTQLMRYLARLITPPNGTVLDPFTGSGSTGKAAILEGFNFIGIEKDPDYCAIAHARIKAAIPPMFTGKSER